LIYSTSENRLSRFDAVLSNSLKQLDKQKLIERRGDNWVSLAKGEAVARSAISILAYDTIAQLFENMKSWDGNFYAGDVLFAICGCPEIAESNYMGLSDKEKTSTLFIKQLWRSDVLTRDVQVHVGSNLDRVIKDTVSPSEMDSIRMKRIIALGQWMTGISPLGISKKINNIGKTLRTDSVSSLSIDAGHLRSMGDVMGWLIESAANLSRIDETLRSYEKPLRQLAARIQYGLPDEIIPLAKLQVKGLNRMQLMNLVRDCVTSRKLRRVLSLYPKKCWMR
jgi:replicative superfamily II helicase